VPFMSNRAARLCFILNSMLMVGAIVAVLLLI
jgi:hypothetical protein